MRSMAPPRDAVGWRDATAEEGYGQSRRLWGIALSEANQSLPLRHLAKPNGDTVRRNAADAKGPQRRDMGRAERECWHRPKAANPALSARHGMAPPRDAVDRLGVILASPAVRDRLDQQRFDCRTFRLSHPSDLHVSQLFPGALEKTRRILE